MLTFLSLSLLLLLGLPKAHSSLLDIRDICCTLGSQYGALKNTCSRYIAPLTNIKPEDEENCRVIVEICCMKEIHYKQCLKGRTDAEEKKLCQVNADVYGAEQYSQCCQCCRLGKVAVQSGLHCNLTNYGDPCDTTFRECCQAERIRLSGGNPYSSCDLNNPCDHFCENDGYSFKCICRTGFVLNADRRTCSDINECLQFPRPCPDRQRCINIPGNFICRQEANCPEHAIFNRLTSSCRCQSKMVYNVTSKECQCPPGFAYNIVERLCEDIDECIVQAHNCNISHQCLNLEGSFQCCRTGFTANQDQLQCEDIDECGLADSCPLGLQCYNSPGSFVCRRSRSCGTGYSLNEITQQCDDIDECAQGVHNCGTSRCKNIQGSFRCEMPSHSTPCPAGSIFNSQTETCESQSRETCDPGFWIKNGICVDINECTERVDQCGLHQVCHNTRGSYQCSNTISCGPGLWYDDVGSRCKDIDECAAGNHTCHSNQVCRNTPGGFECDCLAGYLALSNGFCEDINECSHHRRYCPRNANCINTPGSFRCECKAGYESIGTSRQCKDIDECSMQNPCDHHCQNTLGSFKCSCETGYELSLNRRSCQDVDECADPYKQCSYQCQNLPGSFQCSCPSGFRMASDQKSCLDIDECKETPSICRNYDATCINVRGGYKCPIVQCPSAYTKSAYGNPGNSVRCQRPNICPLRDVECLTSPISLSYNFMTFPSKIKIPTTLFTISGRVIASRYFRFNLNLISAEPQAPGVLKITQQYFNLRITGSSAAVELRQEIPGPQDVELQLIMDMYNSDKHQLIGQAESKLFIYVT
ncbi:FBLN1_2 [Acanthosepion pharaonis]|uniref:FBLN1_2 n=1 Tax=Acanthosepion pharaonis TaxID=158019 RepID=A0A812B7N9_ACAPH|nr:FBLN1_2 [Sepia pharaonis]